MTATAPTSFLEAPRFIAEATHREIATIAGAGHYPQAEQPLETAQAILGFLEAHPHGS